MSLPRLLACLLYDVLLSPIFCPTMIAHIALDYPDDGPTALIVGLIDAGRAAIAGGRL